MPLKGLFMRFAAPAIAAYLVHWGVWWLIHEAATIMMFVPTTILNWLADVTPAEFLRVEGVHLSGRLLASEAVSDGLLPIALGLLSAWLVWRRRTHSTDNAHQ
jgi:hypothetical protein